jgi:hypothetical protein
MEKQESLTLAQKLNKIQIELDAPKNQWNSFGKYHYRSCEDILEGLKPLLEKYDCYVQLSDEVVLIGQRYYVKATATIGHNNLEFKFKSTAYAREPENKKGMDESQISGTASSYARKYALNGLFAIDDEKDADDEKSKANPVNQAKSGTSNNKSNSTRKPTEPQLKRLYALTSNSPYSHDDIKAKIKSKWNLESSKDLNVDQYNELCDAIQAVNL